MMPMMPMMPMAAQNKNSLPFRGGSGWGMSTRARSAWQGPAPEQTPTPIHQQTAFPREGGDPDWAPAFAGEQGSARGRTGKRARENREAGALEQESGSRPAQERASMSDRTTASHAPKDTGVVQTPRPPLADLPINCPTRQEKRTIARCRSANPSPRHRPHTPTPPRKCFPASALPILPHRSINANR